MHFRSSNVFQIFHLVLKLCRHPVFERRHARLAIVLVQLQPLRRVQAALAGAGIGDVHLA